MTRPTTTPSDHWYNGIDYIKRAGLTVNYAASDAQDDFVSVQSIETNNLHQPIAFYVAELIHGKWETLSQTNRNDIV